MQAEICRGLAHPIRLEVVHLLAGGPWAFGDLVERMGIAKAKLSQHLSVLQRTGIVTAERQDGRKQYLLNYPEIETACQAVAAALARRLVEIREESNTLLRSVQRAGRRRAG